MRYLGPMDWILLLFTPIAMAASSRGFVGEDLVFRAAFTVVATALISVWYLRLLKKNRDRSGSSENRSSRVSEGISALVFFAVLVALIQVGVGFVFSALLALGVAVISGILIQTVLGKRGGSW